MYIQLASPCNHPLPLFIPSTHGCIGSGFHTAGGAPWDLPPPPPRIFKVMVSKRAVVLNASDGTHGSSQLSCQKPTRFDLRAVIFRKISGAHAPRQGVLRAPPVSHELFQKASPTPAKNPV